MLVPVASGLVKRGASLALGLFFTPPISNAIDTITNTITSLVADNTGNLSFISTAEGQPAALTKSQSVALSTYITGRFSFAAMPAEHQPPLLVDPD
jgi:hypothetical protein